MILVTGGTGLIGSHLIFKLLERGEEVRAIIRSEKSKQNIRQVFEYYNKNFDDCTHNLEWTYGDILDISSLSTAFENVEKAYHCAGYVSFNEKEKKKIFDINILGTRNIVNQCLLNHVDKLVHVSSVAAIESPKDKRKISEDNKWPTSYKSAYSYSKTRAEYEIWRGVEEGLNAVTVNPTVVLGPGNWQSGSSMLFSRIFEGMKFYTSGASGFVDVRDVANAMIHLMDSDISGERFLLNGENTSYKHLLHAIANNFGLKKPHIKANRFMTEIAWRLEAIRAFLTGSEPRVTKISSRTSHKTNTYSASKFIELTNYKFTPLENTLEFTCHNYPKPVYT